MIPNKIIGSMFVGAAVGGSQTLLLRQYVDTPMATNYLSTNPSSGSTGPFLMKQLKGFGSPSAIAGIVAGGVATGIGVYGAMKGRGMLGNDTLNAGLISYGSSALFGGILSGAFPTQAWANAVAVDPSVPFKPAVPQNTQNKGVVIRPVSKPVVPVSVPVSAPTASTSRVY